MVSGSACFNNKPKSVNVLECVNCEVDFKKNIFYQNSVTSNNLKQYGIIFLKFYVDWDVMSC